MLTFCLLLLPLWESVIVLCFVVRYFIAIILMGKRELVALLNLSSWCLVMVERLFLAVPQGCLRFVIVVFLIILTIFISNGRCVSKYKKQYFTISTMQVVMVDVSINTKDNNIPSGP